MTIRKFYGTIVEMNENKSIWQVGRYNIHNFILSPNITGNIHWRSSSTDKDWVAYFLGTKIGSWDKFDDAKAAVEKRAKVELEYALQRLAEAKA